MKREVVHIPILGVTRGRCGPAQCGRWVLWYSGDHEQTVRGFEYDRAHGRLGPYCKQCVVAASAKRRRKGVVPRPA